MKLSEIKKSLNGIEHIHFILPNGEQVPAHFHITEVGSIQKHFIDCGGTVRKESVINFQLYTAKDYDHRLSVEKLRAVIELSEKKLGLEDLDVEVEYQGDTIGKFELALVNGALQLINTKADCLAKDNCGIPQESSKVRISELQNQATSCAPSAGCC
jgi:hypothetical protein